MFMSKNIFNMVISSWRGVVAYTICVGLDIKAKAILIVLNLMYIFHNITILSYDAIAY